MEVQRSTYSDKRTRSDLESCREEALICLRPKDLSLLERKLSHRQGKTSPSKCLLDQCYCTCHTSKIVSGRFWSLKIPQLPIWNSCDKPSCGCYRTASIWISLNAIGIPYAVIASVEVMLTSRQSYISPSLKAKRVVNWDSPAFALLGQVRWNQMEFGEARKRLVHLFDTGQASPIDILPNGKTLPEVLICVLKTRMRLALIDVTETTYPSMAERSPPAPTARVLSSLGF